MLGEYSVLAIPSIVISFSAFITIKIKKGMNRKICIRHLPSLVPVKVKPSLWPELELK